VTIYRCAACGVVFQPRPQSPHQKYCIEPSCQRERKRRWQQTKRETDADYRENQARAQRAWSRRRPEYWREYRRKNPAYAASNRQQQAARNGRRRLQQIAKSDACRAEFPLASGIYRVRCLEAPNAKKDAWTAELTLLMLITSAKAINCKERTAQTPG
jgi:hypothetical protein